MNHLTWNHQVPVIQLLFINHLTWEPPQVTVVHQSSDLEPPSHCYFIRLGTTGATKPLLFVNHLTQIVVVVVVKPPYLTWNHQVSLLFINQNHEVVSDLEPPSPCFSSIV